jgi:GntR family transcriptional regulator, carbon starvation induced regulator
MKKDRGKAASTTGGGADLALTDIVERLRSDILDGFFGSSEPLRFRSLSERYGTSISTLREALARLTGERLVEFTPNSGYRVIQASLPHLMDISRARLEIETAALRLSIENGDEDWEAGIVAAFHKLNRAQEELERNNNAASLKKWEMRHREFHLSLVSGCGSEWLLHSCETLRVLSDRYRYVMKAPTTAHPPLVTQHKPLAETAIARRANEACELLREHILLSLDIITGEKVVVLNPERGSGAAFGMDPEPDAIPNTLGTVLAKTSPKSNRRRSHEDDSS